MSFAYDSFDRAMVLIFVLLATFGTCNVVIIAFNVMLGTEGTIVTALPT